MRSFRAALAALSLLLVACGSGEDVTPDGAGRGPDRVSFPVSVEAANGRVTLSDRPERIVSLSPTSTEMLFAIGAGDQVAAVDDQSNYPPEAPTTDLSGFEPNVEAIAGYDPDLVLVSNPGEVVKSLGKLEIPVIVHPAAATFRDVYAQIEQLGAVTGHVANAVEVVAQMQDEVDQIVESVPDVDRAPTYYHELDPNYFTATSDTFIGHVYGLLGLRNIADRAKGAASGYPQLSAEYIIQADPDLIFLADTNCCDVDARALERRPGWEQISAVKNNNVVELDDDIASRWGPRVIDLLRTVADAVTGARART
ncbi:MAG: ABC transporter substrate-binding protein [Actinomycetota bacterium]